MQQRQIRHLTLEQITYELRHNPDFKDLEIQPFTTHPILNNKVGVFSYTTVEELTQLADALKQNTSLRCIRINYSAADNLPSNHHDIAKLISESLKNHPSLRSLIYNLSSSAITKATLLGYLQCLTGSAKIEIFTLRILRDAPDLLNSLGELFQKKNCFKEIIIQCTDFLKNNLSTEIIPLYDFAKGLGAQQKLQILKLGFLELKDDGIREIGLFMGSVTSLKELEFRSCHIENEAKQVCSIALNNHELTTLSLSNNRLEETSIEEITRTLPKLNYLTDLNLSNTQMTSAGLKLLVNVMVQQHLKIRTLNLGSQNFKKIDPSAELIAELIKSSHLKKLFLKYMSSTQFEKLAPLLADPNKCKLQKFYFIDPSALLTNESHSLLLFILYHNNQLYDIGPIRKSREIQIACDRNLRKKYMHEWNLFINAALCLLSIDYLTSTGGIKTCAFAIHLFLSFLAPKKPIKTRENYPLYVNLIEQNLQSRQIKIKQKEYDPETDLPKNAINSNRETIKSIWWKTSIEEEKTISPLPFFSEEKGTFKQLFAPKGKLQPSQATLTDMIQIISPYIYSENTQEIIPDNPSEDKKILIDVSHLNAGEQRYIKDIFLRLVKFSYFNPKPAVDILAGIGKLQITKLSLQEIKVDMTAFSDPAIAPASNACCNTM